MKIVNSENIKIYGHGGIATPEIGGSLYIFENSKDFLITLIADQVNLKTVREYKKGRFKQLNIMDYYPLMEKTDSKVMKFNPLYRPVIYMWGKPELE